MINTHRSTCIQKGFTLIETLVALAILLAVVTGFLSLMRTSVYSLAFANDELTAMYLSQDVMEYIKALRDREYDAGRSVAESPEFQHFYDECLVQYYDDFADLRSWCIVDTTDFDALTAIQRCPSTVYMGNCPTLRYDASTGLYHHGSSGTQTQFQRTVRVFHAREDHYTITVFVRFGPNFRHEVRQRYTLVDFVNRNPDPEP